jgi:muconolactone D-isomerase
VEFLVEIEIALPATMDDAARQDLVEAEARRGGTLIAEGVIQRIWRVPGRTANVGIWVAEDATQLHVALQTLPFFPWMDITVRPLATHPLEERS